MNDQPFTLTPGRMVHFVLSAGYCRPAVIVRVWTDPTTQAPDTTLALAVFVDGPRDIDPAAGLQSPLIWQSAVPCDPTGQKERTWHFLELEPLPTPGVTACQP